MRRLLLTTIVICGAAFPAPGDASAATCDFTGVADWNTAINWSCGHVPTTGDDAIIAGGDTAQLAATPATNPTNLSIAGGTISFTANNPTITPSGAVSVTSGTLTGNGTVSVSGGAVFSKTTGGQFSVFNSADVVLSTAASQDGGEICLNDSSGTGAAGDPSFQINAAYTITVNAGVNPFNCNGGLDNAGLLISATGSLTKDGAGTKSILTPLDNDGTITTSAGQLNLSGGDGGNDAGTFTTAASAVTMFNSTFTLTAAATITGAGTTQIQAGTVTLPGGATFTPTTVQHNGGTLAIGGTTPTLTPATYNLQGGTLNSTRALQPTSALNVTSGTFTGNFTTTVSGGAVFSKTTGGQFSVFNSADVVLSTAASQDGGEICLNDSSGTGAAGDPSFQINAAYTITVNAGVNPFNCNGGLDNAGLLISATGSLTKDGAGTKSILTPLDNDGTITTSAGQLNLSGGDGGNDAGTFTTAASAVTMFNSTFTLTAAATITGAGTTQIQAGTVTLPGGATFTPTTVQHNGGTLAIGGTTPTLTPATYNLQGGTLNSTRALQPTSALNVTSGTFTGNFTTTVSGGAVFSKTTGGQFSVFNSADVVLSTAASQDGGEICLNDSSGTGAAGDPSFQINAAYTITVNAGVNPFNCNGGLDNAGLLISATGSLTKDGAGTKSILTPLDNDGTITTSAGQLNLSGGDGGNDAGTFTTAASAVTMFNSTFTLTAAATITGAGTTQIQAGTVTLPGGATFTPTTVQHNGGTLAIGGTTPTLTPATYNLQGGTLNSTRALQPTSALNVTSGTFTGNFTTTVSGGAVFSKTTGGQFSVFNSADVVLSTAASQDGGEICLNDSSGTGAAGDPSFQINAAYTITVNAGVNPFNCNGGLDNAGLLISATGSLTKDGAGTKSILTPLDNDGTITTSAGQLNLSGGDGGNDAGTFTTAASAVTMFNSTFTLTAAATITGAGTTQIQAGTVTLPGGATFTPTTVQHNGGTLAIGGTTPTLTPATYNLQGGTLNSTRALQPTSALNVTSGTFTGNFTTTVSGGAVFSKTTGGQFSVFNSADVVLSTAASQDGGEICLNDSSGTGAAGDPSFQINAAYTITVNAGVNPFNCNGGLDNAGLLINAGGTLSKNSNNTSSILTPTRVAGGTLTVASGQTLNVSAGLEQTGGQTTVAAGAAMGGNSSSAISGGVMTVDGTYAGNPTVTGTGVLRGAGTINGTATNSSGTIRPGTSPGTLTINGNFSQGASGTLEVDIDGTTPGTQFDVLDVSGSASLDGTLKVVQGGGFDPGVSDVFAFMTSGSRSGTFATLDAPALGGGKSYQLDYPGTPDFGARLLLSPPTPPVNTALPSITGTVALSQTITCDPGTWTNNPTFTFQWLRDGQAIGGATQSTYAIVSADVTHQLSCQVTATNPSGTDQKTSAGATVPPIAPQNTTPPSITGTAAVGSQLTCADGSWSGVPAPSLTRQWLRDGQPISGATDSAYTATGDDATHALTCRVSASNAGGSASATTSERAVPATTPQNTAAPSITGGDKQGDKLTCTLGTWAGFPAPALTVQWLRDGTAIVGAGQATYVLSADDAGKAITCLVTGTNAAAAVAATSKPLSAAKAAEQVLAEKTTEQVATVLGLPSAKQCLSRRLFKIRVRQPAGVKVRSAAVLVGGKKVKTTKVAGRFNATVDLRGLPKGSFTVKITITTTNGRKIVGQRRYKTCLPKRKSGGPKL